jgi:prevent-host-death family protein
VPLRSRNWNLQDAKARLSEVVDLAASGKPQVIMRRGKPAAAVISIDQYNALTPKASLISFLLASPLRGAELDLSHAETPYEPPNDIFGDGGDR